MIRLSKCAFSFPMKGFFQIFNKCFNIFWNFYNISCLRFGYLNSDRCWPFTSKKLPFDFVSIVTFAISEILIGLPLSSREIIIFLKSSGVVYWWYWWFIVIGNFIIFGINSSQWIFYIFSSYFLFHISNGDIMGSQLISIEPYTNRFLFVSCDIYRCNTFITENLSNKYRFR